MHDVAVTAGVSAKTVSRVVRGDRYVSDDVRGRVERAIADLHYVPNVLARSFRTGSDAAIGVAVPDLSDPFFAAVIRAVEQVARARGMVVIVTGLGDDGAQERAGVEALLGRQLAGLVATPVSGDQSYLRPWQSRTALVFIDRAPGRVVADSVVEDDFAGARAATAHLVEHGHRRIGFIGDTLRVATTANRLKGYRAALTDAGIDPDPDLVALGDAGRATLELLSGAAAPTALFSSNARCSQQVVPALQSIGRTDTAVISFGDFPLAGALYPSLTVVDQDPDAVGRAAADRLFERLEHPGRRLRRRIVLPVALVRRASCAVGQHSPGPGGVCGLRAGD